MPTAATQPKGPGGRPKKQPDERRSARAECRLTLAEKQFLREQHQAAGMTEAEYLRHRALGQPVVVRKAKSDHRLVHELNAIGVNLNQIAKLHNAGRIDTRTAELDGLMRQLRSTLDKAVDALDD